MCRGLDCGDQMHDPASEHGPKGDRANHEDQPHSWPALRDLSQSREQKRCDGRDHVARGRRCNRGNRVPTSRACHGLRADVAMADGAVCHRPWRRWLNHWWGRLVRNPCGGILGRGELRHTLRADKCPWRNSTGRQARPEFRGADVLDLSIHPQLNLLHGHFSCGGWDRICPTPSGTVPAPPWT